MCICTFVRTRAAGCSEIVGVSAGQGVSSSSNFEEYCSLPEQMLDTGMGTEEKEMKSAQDAGLPVWLWAGQGVELKKQQPGGHWFDSGSYRVVQGPWKWR